MPRRRPTWQQVLSSQKSESGQQRKLVVFDRRRFVIANSRPIPVRALAKAFSEPVISDSFNHNSLIYIWVSDARRPGRRATTKRAATEDVGG